MRHVVAAAERLRDTGAATIEVRGDAHDAFMAELRRRQRRTVWATGGCSSWYLDDQGRDPTNWPGFTFEYRRRTARVSPSVYTLSGASRRSSSSTPRTQPQAAPQPPLAAS